MNEVGTRHSLGFTPAETHTLQRKCTAWSSSAGWSGKAG